MFQFCSCFKYNMYFRYTQESGGTEWFLAVIEDAVGVKLELRFFWPKNNRNGIKI